MNRRLPTVLLLGSLALSLTACADAPVDDCVSAENCDDLDVPDPRVTVLESYEIAALNAGLVAGEPTVDLAIYVSTGAPVSWASLATALEAGRAIFLDAGVQVRVVSALRVEVPEAWQTLDPAEAEVPTTPSLLQTDLYAHLAEAKERMTARNADILAAILSHGPAEDRERTLHLVTLAKVPIGYWEWVNGAWNRGSAPTGGLSMPSYLFEDRIPAAIQGVFTISYTAGAKTVFHEMGHKLINVSHEGAGVCPSFAADGPELMLYGAGTLIGAGAGNRWHRERLQQSPYLYRETDAGKVFNPPNAAAGAYNDPLYGDHVVSPVCGG